MSEGIIALIGRLGVILGVVIKQARSRADVIALVAAVALIGGLEIFAPKVAFGLDNGTRSGSESSRKEMTLNEEVVCVDNCAGGSSVGDSTVPEVRIIYFTRDYTHNQTSIRVLVKSQRNEANCSFGSGQGFEFQDETGKTYPPGGQLKNGGSFSLVKDKPIILTAIYSFSPVPGLTYTLRPLHIYCSGYPSNAAYADIQFTFEDP